MNGGQLKPGWKGPIRDAVRRAFVATCATAPAEYHFADPNSGPAADDAARVTRVGVIVPTLESRCGVIQLFEALERLGDSMARARAAHADFDFVLMIAMQGEGSAGAHRCRRRLEEIEQRWTSRFEIPFAGVALPACSKVLAINSCRSLLEQLRATIVAWFDDDVIVDEDCIARLIEAFDPGADAVYGARKITISDKSGFSRWWADRKNCIEPVNAYPHGCAVWMSVAEFGEGIPCQYQSDDNYLLLDYLRPSADNPFERLRVVSDAIIRVPAANHFSQTIQRIARNYRNGIRTLADAPPATIRFFLRRIMFPGIRWPRSCRELLTGGYYSHGLWHSLKLVFWLGIAGAVVVRGICRRPKAATWYTAPYPSTLGERP